VEKIIAPFLVKCADKTSAVSVFVCLYSKEDTPTVVSPWGMHSFLLRFYFYLSLLFLFYLFILFYLFFVKKICMHVHPCLCVQM